MTARARLRGRAINAYLGSRNAKRSLHAIARFARGGRRPATFYYRVDDPYSHLLTQVLPGFVQHHGLDIELMPVAKASAGAHPEPDLLAHHSARDAVLLADQFGLDFPSQWTFPTEDRVRRAHAVLLKPRPSMEQLHLARQLGDAVWRDRGSSLAELVDQHGAVSGAELSPRLEANYVRLEKAGHYQSGMLNYAGEWYWGIDRLAHLDHRLHQEGSAHTVAPVVRPAAARGLIGNLAASSGERAKLEMYFSFRSPYSYLALAMVEEMKRELDFDLQLKPVLPMVMRGLPVPRSKRLYIVHDAKREADRLQIPFGRVCDPVGQGVENCVPVFFAAEQQGLGLTFARIAMQAIWSEAAEVAVVDELIPVAVQAGLHASDVRIALGRDEWRATVDQHRVELFDMGLWGVPSFKIGDYVTWGQDRLPYIAERIAAHRVV